MRDVDCDTAFFELSHNLTAECGKAGRAVGSAADLILTVPCQGQRFDAVVGKQRDILCLSGQHRASLNGKVHPVRISKKPIAAVGLQASLKKPKRRVSPVFVGDPHRSELFKVFYGKRLLEIKLKALIAQ